MNKPVKSDDWSLLDQYPAGLDLYKRIRGAFIGQQTSLTKYAAANNLNYNTVRQCLFGINNGEKGKALRLKIIRDAKLPPIINKEDAA